MKGGSTGGIYSNVHVVKPEKRKVCENNECREANIPPYFPKLIE